MVFVERSTKAGWLSLKALWMPFKKHVNRDITQFRDKIAYVGGPSFRRRPWPFGERCSRARATSATLVQCVITFFIFLFSKNLPWYFCKSVLFVCEILLLIFLIFWMFFFFNLRDWYFVIFSGFFPGCFDRSRSVIPLFFPEKLMSRFLWGSAQREGLTF